MKTLLSRSVFRIMLFACVCILSGATVSYAQSIGNELKKASPDELQQEIDRLQKLVEIQRLQQQLQQGETVVPQGTVPEQQPAAEPWLPDYVRRDIPQTHEPVTLRPQDTGRTAVTFSIDGGGSEHSSRVAALKINLLYGATLTPNLALEIGLGGHTTLDLAGGYNRWSYLYDDAQTGRGTDIFNSYKRLMNLAFAKAEFRYWFRGRFDGHFLGLGAFYTDYHLGEMKVPLLFEPDYDYNGNGYGLQLSWGYLWSWSRHWGMEFSLAGGVAILDYDKSFIDADGDGYELIDPIRYRKTYLGPTGAGIKIVYAF